MPQILSCYTNNFGPAGVWQAVEKIGSTGLNRLELAMKGHNLGGLVIAEDVVVTEKADDATAERFVALLREKGVRVSGCNVGGGDPRTPEGVELITRRIAFSRKWFHVDRVISGTGPADPPEARGQLVSGLRSIGDAAAALGVTVALETHAGPTQNAASMLALMKAVDHPAIRLNFDTGNIAYYNEGANPVHELEQVAPLVANVHLKDNRGRYHDWYFPPLGEGVVDFREIRSVLDAAGFAGPCTIELEGIAGEPEPGLAERCRRIEQSLAHLRSCGYLDA